MNAECLICLNKKDVNENFSDDLWCHYCKKVSMFRYVSPQMVILTCDNSYYDVDKVKFINISEGMIGEDIITFECPKCNKEHESLILG